MESPLHVAARSSTASVPARPPDPCTLVLFGATGDLAHRKIVPALFELAKNGELPEPFGLVATSTSVGAAEGYREQLRQSFERFSGAPADAAAWAAFAAGIDTVAGDYTRPEAFGGLRAAIEAAESRRATSGNRLFYLAAPPAQFAPILSGLRQAGLVHPSNGTPWSRVVIEKPFGRDLASARELNRLVATVLDERQTFRIDHYLGKETVQNILVFRFGNSIFEPLWNRKYVDHVADHDGRGRSASSAAASSTSRPACCATSCRTTCSQVLALDGDGAADHRSRPTTSATRSSRCCALRMWATRAGATSCSASTGATATSRASRADSRTPTFAALRVLVDNWRWQGVPFYLRAGKRLAHRMTEVSIHFQPIPFCLFGSEDVCELHRAERARRCASSPTRASRCSSRPRCPGDDLTVGSVTMDFRYAEAFGGAPPEAYERLLLDAMRGDATLFARRDGDEQAWSLLAPLLEGWESSSEEPAAYEGGGDGPREAERLPRQDGRRWRSLDGRR